MPKWQPPEGYQRVPYQTGGTVRGGVAYGRTGKPLRSPVTGRNVRARPGQEKHFRNVYGPSLTGQLRGLGY